MKIGPLVQKSKGTDGWKDAHKHTHTKRAQSPHKSTFKEGKHAKKKTNTSSDETYNKYMQKNRVIK
jgi:hypothetical protein